MLSHVSASLRQQSSAARPCLHVPVHVPVPVPVRAAPPRRTKAVACRFALLPDGGVADMAAGVLPDFLDACARYLCAPPLVDAGPAAASACLRDLEVPPPEGQLAILHALHDLAMRTDIEGLRGVFMRYLLDGRTEAVQRLLEHVAAYNDHLGAIREAVRDL